MTRKSFEPTLGHHFRQAWTILIYALVLVSGPILVWYQYGPNRLPLAFSISGALFLTVFISHAVLHVRYTRVSRGMSFTFNNLKKQIQIRRYGIARVVKDEQIAKVECVAHRSLVRNEAAMYPWQAYGYAVVRLKSGEYFVVTTLAVPDFRWPYEFREAEIREVVYPWPPFSSLQ